MIISHSQITRRCLLTACLVLIEGVSFAQALMSVDENRALHETLTQGIKVFPGQWRPNFSSEQIVWVSPPWRSDRPEYGQEFIYLDFPETVKVGKTLIYLSHVHPRFPAVYNHDLEKVSWRTAEGKVSYERTLPNGLSFRGSVSVLDSMTVKLTIAMTNNTGGDLDSIWLQTCAFLNPIREFSASSDSNKYVFIKGQGWTSLATALKLEGHTGKYYVGWLGGYRNVDLPFIVVRSGSAERYVVFSWLKNSYSFIGNPNHPCFHSDPWFPDLKNGQEGLIEGVLLFYEGHLEELERILRKRFSF